MNINMTLFGQMITFILLVAFTVKYIWPPITKAMAERQAKIAEGLAAADRGKHELELAQLRATEMLRDAKIQAAKFIEDASKRGSAMIDDAKMQARAEGARLIELAKNEIIIEQANAREALRRDIASLALLGAEKILGQHVDADAHEHLMQQLLTEVKGD